MAQFTSGESKTAKVTMRNPTSKAFDYEGVIYMGTNLAEMSRVLFNLGAGAEKVVSFPVIMPPAVGVYPVYVGVFSGGVNVALYRAVEDVTLVPGYKAAIGFSREKVCMEGYMDESNTWVCTRYSSEERSGRITITNQGSAGSLTTTIEGWLYLSGVKHNILPFWGVWNPTQWTDYFGVGQIRAYDILYMVPTTGMAFDSRFFITVYSPTGEVVAEETFITSL